ncbi:hypothetical protein DFJ74DRAFT_323690 [Hyaloraphidium curvatum]|nr:hypothetical protein DFJ74DRAFT_323690 [Hyaloraphidium curvatum]
MLGPHRVCCGLRKPRRAGAAPSGNGASAGFPGLSPNRSSPCGIQNACLGAADRLAARRSVAWSEKPPDRWRVNPESGQSRNWISVGFPAPQELAETTIRDGWYKTVRVPKLEEPDRTSFFGSGGKLTAAVDQGTGTDLGSLCLSESVHQFQSRARMMCMCLLDGAAESGRVLQGRSADIALNETRRAARISSKHCIQIESRILEAIATGLCSRERPSKEGGTSEPRILQFPSAFKSGQVTLDQLHSVVFYCVTSVRDAAAPDARPSRLCVGVCLGEGLRN